MVSKDSGMVSERGVDVIDLFVDPEVRGEGLGRKLTQAVADFAREKGFMRVQWVTKHDNTAARKLYDTLAESQFVQYRMAL